MKALLFLVVVLAGVWLYRSRQASGDKEVPSAKPAPPLDMVRCARCGMHVPGNEAIQGHDGPYCCPEHLKQSEH